MTAPVLLAGVLAAVAAICALGSAATVRDRTVALRASPSNDRRTGHAGAAPLQRVRSVLAIAGSRPLVERLGTSASILRSVRSLGTDGESVRQIAGIRACAAGCGVALGVGVGSVPLALATALLGLAVPPLVLARMARARVRRVDAELPQLLDLLAAASHAGLSGSLSLRRATDAIEGPLADELHRVLGAVDLGARWREELAALASRLDLPDLRRAVAALTRTERLGASLADSVTDLAVRVRESRRAATTARARTAPIKMLFPLVFLVLPAFLLLTVVPVLFSTVRSIR